MSDAWAILSWWLIIQALGWAVWPLAFRLSRWLPDRGYTLAKPCGLLLVSYFGWLSVSLHLLPNTITSVLIAWVALAAGSALVYRREKTEWLNWLRDHRWLVISYELLFAMAFIGWAIFRAHVPDVVTGEKPMELAFLNAISRSTTFPPPDPWLSGFNIAYYYFGYVMMSLLQRLSGADAGVTFSLSNALWFALSAAGAFGIAADLVLLTKRSARRAAIFFGVLGAVLLVLAGNFEAPLEVAYANNQGPDEFWQQLDILDLNQPRTAPLAWPPREMWWWRASRVIHDYPPDSVSPRLAAVSGIPADPNTAYQEIIDEFPQFSFLLGDMHPHVLNLPFVLVYMALALNLYQAARAGAVRSLWQAPLWTLYPLVLGASGFINTWDFPIYVLTTAAALALGCWQRRQSRWRDRLADLLLLGIPGVILYLPFYLNFTSQASGLGANPFNGTRVSQFFIVFGPLLVINAMFALKLIGEARRAQQIRLGSFTVKSVGGGLLLTLLAAFATAVVTWLILSRTSVSPDIQSGITDPFMRRFSLSLGEFYREAIATLEANGITQGTQLLARLSDPWVPIILGSGLCAIVLLWRVQRPRSADQQPAENSPLAFVLLLAGIGLLLTFGVEFVFIGDLFKTRMNTLFKFYFEAWALWSVAGAYGLYYLLSGPRHLSSNLLRLGVGSVACIALGLGLFYPALAISTRLQEITPAFPTLDGVTAAAQGSSLVADIATAVDWLNRQAAGSPVILEAASDETIYRASRSRLSSWTGLPTVLGWYWHETQWRGNDREQRQRLPDVTTIYSTTDQDMARSLLQRYNVAYILVGERERKQYPAEGLAKFDRMFPIAFQQGTVTLYRVE